MTTARTGALELDSDGRMSAELPCVSCGYLLRGLRPGDRCPECVTEVRRTIAAQDPRSWPRDWLIRVRRGLSLLMLATALGVVFTIWFGLCTLYTISVPRPTTWLALQPLKKYLWEPGLAVLALAAVALGVGGMLMITFSDAARAISPWRLWERQAARAGFALGAILFAALVALLFLIQDQRRDFLFWLWIPMFATAIGGLWNLLTHMGRLAQRLGSDRLARRCWSMRWVVLLGLALAFFEATSIWTVIGWLPIVGRVQWWRTVAALDSAVLTARVALVAIGLLAIQLLGRYRAEVKKCL